MSYRLLSYSDNKTNPLEEKYYYIDPATGNYINIFYRTKKHGLGDIGMYTDITNKQIKPTPTDIYIEEDDDGPLLKGGKSGKRKHRKSKRGGSKKSKRRRSQKKRY